MLADLLPTLVVGLAKAMGRPQVDLLGQPYEGALGRPDFSVKDGGLLIGHVETKPPGAGADVRRFRGHDRDQWNRFKQLPNLLYTDGSDFALYRSGARLGKVATLDVEASVRESGDVAALTDLVAQFLSWRAVAPRSLSDLAETLAPLCALLRDAVRDQLGRKGSEVSKAAKEVEEALFADRSQDEIADAVAQVCTYSMLLARSRGAADLGAAEVESTLGHAHPVLGRVVRLLVDEQTEGELGWALDTVRAVVEAVDFPALEAKAGADAWLYFYETFLARYDARLRDQYGVYYTPAEVISAQVALLDEIIRTRFEKPGGLAAEGVTILDPAVGTGSYPLRVIAAAADAARQTRGEGAVSGVVSGLARNLFAFEVLVGPYAVAHLRISEAIEAEGGRAPDEGLHVYLTDTLENPFSEPLDFGRQLAPLVEERKRAQQVKGEQSILVCLGNPPYERLSAEDETGAEKGGWVVHGEGGGAGAAPIFSDFLDPARQHTRFSHLASLYNLYVYFWRWALWKVFEAPGADGELNDQPGVVSFISAASYLTGPGFLGMREHLRRVCDEIWVIDLGGEGHGARKEQNVFAIQTPVAICLAVRSQSADSGRPARVRYTRISGDRDEKLRALAAFSQLSDLEWREADAGWHAPFVPASAESWLRHPKLADLFPLQLPGPMLNRTWPVAPTRDVGEERWRGLSGARKEDKAAYFAEGRFGRSTTSQTRGGYPPAASSERIVDLTAASPQAAVMRYAYRSFDRQWIVADVRVMRTPSQALWRAHSERQVYMAGLLTAQPGSGPGVTLAAHVPDKHYFRGSVGGKDIIPLYRDASGSPNVPAGLLAALGAFVGQHVKAEDLFAYCYALLSSRSYVLRFWDELETPGPRVPITRDGDLFAQAVELGRELINLHTHGERLTDLGRGVNPGAARLVDAIGPAMPDDIAYDTVAQELRVGVGRVTPVSPEIWEYEVSGLRVLRSWLRYRMREPVGKARSSKSPLDRIRPTTWTSELDQELLELVWVLERTLALEPRQRDLLDAVCSGPTVNAHELPTPTGDEREAPIHPKSS